MWVGEDVGLIINRILITQRPWLAHLAREETLLGKGGTNRRTDLSADKKSRSFSQQRLSTDRVLGEEVA